MIRTPSNGHAYVIDSEDMTIGVSNTDRDNRITVKNHCGMSVDGRPGTGKTFLLESLTNVLTENDYGRILVVDGESGYGNEWLRTESAFVNVLHSDDAVEILSFLKEFENMVEEKKQVLVDECEVETFWQLSVLERLMYDVRLDVLIVDELIDVIESAINPVAAAECVAVMKRLIDGSADAGVLVVLSSSRMELQPKDLIGRCSAQVKFLYHGYVETTEDD